MPAIAQRIQTRSVSLLFIDAVLPPARGVHRTPAGLRALLDEQTVEGRLRRWLEWLPDDVVSELSLTQTNGPCCWVTCRRCPDRSTTSRFPSPTDGPIGDVGPEAQRRL
jgi:hypothetical protein